jgi:hypothetical protein
MLSILLAAAVAALPEPPTSTQVQEAVETTSVRNVERLDQLIQTAERALEEIERGKVKIEIGGKAIPKAVQAKFLKGKIKEAKEHRELAKEKKWFRPMPPSDQGFQAGEIYSGVEMTFVKSQDGLLTFERDYSIPKGAELIDGTLRSGGKAEGTLKVLVRGLNDEKLRPNRKTKVLEGKPLFVAGQTTIPKGAGVESVYVLDVVDPGATAKVSEVPQAK